MPITHPEKQIDFTLIVNEKSFPISKCIFGLYSKKFREHRSFFFDHSLDISESNISIDAFSQFIKGCQEQFYEINIHNCFQFFHLCEVWEVPVLQKEVSSFISNIEDHASVIKQLDFLLNSSGERPMSSDNLVQTIENTITNNINDYLSIPIFATLPLFELVKIVKKAMSSPKKIDSHNFYAFLSSEALRHKESWSIFFRLIEDFGNFTQDELTKLAGIEKGFTKSQIVQQSATLFQAMKTQKELLDQLVVDIEKTEFHDKKNADQIKHEFANLRQSFTEGGLLPPKSKSVVDMKTKVVSVFQDKNCKSHTKALPKNKIQQNESTKLDHSRKLSESSNDSFELDTLDEISADSNSLSNQNLENDEIKPFQLNENDSNLQLRPIELSEIYQNLIDLENQINEIRASLSKNGNFLNMMSRKYDDNQAIYEVLRQQMMEMVNNGRKEAKNNSKGKRSRSKTKSKKDPETPDDDKPKEKSMSFFQRLGSKKDNTTNTDRHTLSMIDNKPFLSTPHSRHSFMEPKNHPRSSMKFHNPEPIMSSEIVCQLNDNNPLDGIIKYLTCITASGQNVHKARIVDIQASSSYTPARQPYSLFDRKQTNCFWRSGDKEGQWIKFDFMNRQVMVTAYSIKTIPYDSNSFHLKSWIIEGTNAESFSPEEVQNDDPNIIWTPIDIRENDQHLKSTSVIASFSVPPQNEKQYYRYIRLRMIGANHHSSKVLALSGFELFGKLRIVNQ